MRGVVKPNAGKVSIHAPTRGATKNFAVHLKHGTFQSTHPHGVRQTWCSPVERTYQVSIHAPTRGATGYGKYAARLIGVSIHAPTRGATFRKIVCFTILFCFNPRTHTGCDSVEHSFLRFFRVSIHAPTRGATTLKRGAITELNVSIHAPTRGATTAPLNTAAFARMFQSTHPHGVRQTKRTKSV